MPCLSYSGSGPRVKPAHGPVGASEPVLDLVGTVFGDPGDHRGFRDVATVRMYQREEQVAGGRRALRDAQHPVALLRPEQRWSVTQLEGPCADLAQPLGLLEQALRLDEGHSIGALRRACVPRLTEIARHRQRTNDAPDASLMADMVTDASNRLPSRRVRTVSR